MRSLSTLPHSVFPLTHKCMYTVIKGLSMSLQICYRMFTYIISRCWS